ncbi:MAG: anti-sigma factor antagonist, partial [Gemmatimonadetes bacterium]
MQRLTITIDERDGATVLALVGDAALEHADELERAASRALGARPARLIVDLTGVSFIGSLGVGIIIAVCVQTQKQRGRAVVACPPGNAHEVLARCRLDAVAPIVASVDDAIAA